MLYIAHTSTSSVEYQQYKSATQRCWLMNKCLVHKKN